MAPPIPKPSGDPKLAAFDALVGAWSLAAEADAAKLAADGDGASQRRRAPMWRAIDLAKKSGLDADWDMAMDMLANAALGHRRPVMVASVALSSILRQGHDVPFPALAKLVDPILHEKSLGAPCYQWDDSFPVRRSREAWIGALRASRMAGPPPAKPRP